MIIRNFLLFFLFVGIFLIGGKFYTNSAPQSLNPPTAFTSLKIVTSFTILQDFVQKITKDVPHVEIISIVPPESDPHTYQPTPYDGKILTEADVIFINGLDFEKNIERMLESTSTKAIVSRASKNVKVRPDLKDPHTWHNVENAKLYVKEITEVLSNLDPNNANLYKRNSNAFLKELENLDNWIHQKFVSIPSSKRVVVTTHDAFWYLGQAYHIKFLSPIGISTESEASPQDVAVLIDFIRKHNIKAVFVENLANKRLIEQIARETNNSLQGTLYADSLSVPTGPAYDYISMMKHNIETIYKALNQ